MTRLFWLHEDFLTLPDEDSHGFFIWDPDYLKEMDYGMKKLAFIYETLCEMKVDIVKGQTVETAQAFLSGHDGVDRLHIYNTPNPRLREFIGALDKHITIERMAPTPFVTLDKAPDLKRFFRYWNKAKKKAMQPHGKDKQGELAI